MDRHLFRVIFNRSRGIHMAVQETSVGGHGNARAGSTRSTRARGFALKRLAAALAPTLCIPVSGAQIIPERSAPGSQRPTVLNSANGTPTVNIQTPSAAGVSRNRYQQFDIGAKGAILNNSRTPVQSQIGGRLQGNEWLARGSARVIVNEVQSQASSRLMGPLEVAGQRADVVIANPSGLVIDGLSFLTSSPA
ncbi:filamentous hemagglutinin N-terminal domain-containing protein [Comamonas endophytica]|uniref:Filamentous hemagglutinin N-terminal domain-containing protein n=1 Tax=Comamonas endophytica TaxID=2949090 RepID=A0ABY6GHG4_9BURK|nr:MULTISPECIES: filamentous hemagglutinin N-terminal domain-containing protein [unclassified Acidovorax]MCD2513314.1 filamentous hemagglutinin N-terminal domain-containing protein [Acidovorax sp. D4N7]UYG53899.1 filamentous hemagglutinin N-terminal domain-containing protein [Acidovorax sp. 5MLIR]